MGGSFPILEEKIRFTILSLMIARRIVYSGINIAKRLNELQSDLLFEFSSPPSRGENFFEDGKNSHPSRGLGGDDDHF